MKIRLVEPINLEQVSADGRGMYHVRPILPGSPKEEALGKILQNKPCPDFLLLGQWLLNYLNNTDFPCKARDTLEGPLYLMTDFTDPRPLRGLRIEENGQSVDLPDLYFLGFYTDWDDLANSGVDKIFGHEYAHLWFYLLNFDPGKLPGSKFHTCTAVTDPYTAFFEGFAEHLQIVTEDLADTGDRSQELWDCAMGLKAWLCVRDEQLRRHAVKNNRFIYQTALPDPREYSSYADLHIAHITSSAFMPEKLKNGSQVAASEGAVAAIFYHIYASPFFKNQACPAEFYRWFGTKRADVNPIQNLYLKVFHALAKTDLGGPRPLTEFIRKYGECFPAEQDELYKLFLELTHYTTVSHQAAEIFGELYRIGRRGKIEEFKHAYKEAAAFKEELLAAVLAGDISLDAALYPAVWVRSSATIPPVPWEPREVQYTFDINTASEVDLLALEGVDLKEAGTIITAREERQGFKTLEDFRAVFPGRKGREV